MIPARGELVEPCGLRCLCGEIMIATLVAALPRWGLSEVFRQYLLLLGF